MSADAYPTSLDGWLRYIEACHPSEIELGLTRLAQVAQRLPIDLSRSLRIVVGGTNGKGSTLAMLDAVLRAQGLSTGVYTSPHFLRYNERIQLNGQPVADQQLCAVFAQIEQARGDIPLTYFEYGTLAALLVFSQAAVDVALLEVGLGGRLDAVNLVDADIAVVTTVALDHTDWLGPDRESIGFEKAGIFRAGKPALCGDPDAPTTLVGHAEHLGAPLYRNGIDYRYRREADGWDWSGHNGAGEAVRYHRLPLPGLPLANAALVVQILQLLPWAIDEQALRGGLQNARLTGRMQPASLGQLALTLDVAHNPEAAAYLAAQLQQTAAAGEVHLVLGMLADKDIPAVIEALAPAIRHWYPVSLEVPRGARAEVLVAALERAGVPMQQVHPAASVAAALTHLQAQPIDGRVVVAGSFYTVAQALELGAGEPLA